MEGIDPVWFDGLPADIAASAAANILRHATIRLRPSPEWRARLEAAPPDALDDNQHHFLVARLIFEGRLDDAQRLAAGRKSIQSTSDLAWLVLLGGDAVGATAAWEKALTAFLKAFGRRSRYFQDWNGLFFIVALIATGRLGRAVVLAEAAGAAGVSAVPHGHATLLWVARSLLAPGVEDVHCPSPDSTWDPIEVLIHALALRWAGLQVPALMSENLPRSRGGLPWAGSIRRER